jgi:hypothetical protein
MHSAIFCAVPLSHDGHSPLKLMRGWALLPISGSARHQLKSQRLVQISPFQNFNQTTPHA